MAGNADNKVRVTRLFGGGGSLGSMSAKLNMVTDKGTIVQIADSGRYLVAVSGNGVGVPTWHYPRDLYVTEAHATGVHAWPTGDGSSVINHVDGYFDNGVPTGPLPTGMVFMHPNGTPTIFQR